MASSSLATGLTEEAVASDLGVANDESSPQKLAAGGQLHDSGYSSIVSTPDKSVENAPAVTDNDCSSTPRFLNLTKLTSGRSNSDKILFSDIEVDDDARQAYTRIQPHFENQLRDYIIAHPKRRGSCCPLWIRLMMVGVSHDDAHPHIVVFCKPKYKSVVRRFFDQDHVAELCNTSGTGGRRFKLHVEGKAPLLRNAEVQVIAELSPQFPQTLCGMPVSLQHPSGRARNATLGGVIKLVDSFGKSRLYGISAGHTLEALEDAESVEDISEDMEDDTDDDIEEAVNGEAKGHGHRADTLSEANDVASDSWVFTMSEVSGVSVQEPRANGSGPVKHHDWALFDMSSYRPNVVRGEHGRNIHLSTQTPGQTSKRDVYLLSGSGPHGPHDVCKKGVLSPASGRIALGQTLELVDAYMLTLSDASAIHDGDSGSWVVDCHTMELYGHLVATGFLDEGIIVPMKDIFEEIKEQFSATSITLPGDIDFFWSCYETSGVPRNENHKIERPLEHEILTGAPSDSGYQSVAFQHEGLLQQDHHAVPNYTEYGKLPSLQKICVECRTPFPTNSAIEKHASDSGHMAFACRCGAQFSRAYTLARHINSTIGHRFRCELCDHTSFSRLDKLVDHLRDMHRVGAKALDKYKKYQGGNSTTGSAPSPTGSAPPVQTKARVQALPIPDGFEQSTFSKISSVSTTPPQSVFSEFRSVSNTAPEVSPSSFIGSPTSSLGADNWCYSQPDHDAA